MDLELLRKRARIFQQVRAFFDRRGYLEVNTPLLAPDLIPETCLEVFETSRLLPGDTKPGKPYWLIPSPEIWMKRLIARHRTSLYQICNCFRNGESSGRQHSPEFTMLEYYTMEADYLVSLEATEALFGFLLEEMKTEGIETPAEISPPFVRLSVEEAFKKWAGFEIFKAADSAAVMEKEARRLGLNPQPGLSVHALYDLIFIHAVEPRLRLERPVVLMDYPAFVPCLAKKSADTNTVERWELYVRGIELANCFTEETRPQEVRRFFESEKAEKEKSALVKHRVDDNYWKLFDNDNFPPCSGVAMGLDRLIMVLCGKKTVDGVLPFPMEQT